MLRLARFFFFAALFLCAVVVFAQNPFRFYRLPTWPQQTAWTMTDCVMTTSGHSCAGVSWVPAEQITTLAFSMGSVTGGPGTADVRLETVSNTTGQPSGTLVAANTNCSVAITNTEDNSVKSCTMTASYSGGGLVAVRVVLTGSVNVVIPTVTGLGQVPYGVWFTPSAFVASRPPLVGVKFASGDAIGFAGAVAGSSSDEFFANANNPDERGNRMVFTKAFTACGFWLRGGPNTSVSNYALKLYDATPSALLTMTLDGNQVANAGGQNNGDYFFPSPISLAASATYYVTLRATDSGMVIHQISTTSNADMAYMYNGGVNIYSATRDNDTGSFTTLNTKVYSVGLIGCDAPAGSGTVVNRPFFQ